MSIKPTYTGGSGTPMLLIHGFTASWDIWTPILSPLGEHHQLLVPTLPGHDGGGPFPEGIELSIEATADILEQRMEEAGFETAHIVGNSFGGWLAFEMALRGRAKSVVALCPAGGWEHGSKEAKQIVQVFRINHYLLKAISPNAKKIARRSRIKKLLLRDLVANPSKVSPAATARILESAAACSVSLEALDLVKKSSSFSDLGPIDCPVNIAYGTEDKLLPWPNYYSRFQRIIPHAQYTRLEGIGHLPMWDDPALVTQLVLETSAKVDKGTSYG